LGDIGSKGDVGRSGCLKVGREVSALKLLWWERMGRRGTTWLAGQDDLSPVCEVVLLRASIAGQNRCRH
jgi:hypothetical protein